MTTNTPSTKPVGGTAPCASRGLHRVLGITIGAQVTILGILGARGAWSTIALMGGRVTIPLVICAIALIGSTGALCAARMGWACHGEATRRRARRVLLAAPQFAWGLGLLQTLISMYESRSVFLSGAPYDEVVMRLGGITGSAFGSSVIGLGLLLAGWLCQLVTLGRTGE